MLDYLYIDSQSYNRFDNDNFGEDVMNVDQHGVYSADDPEVSLTAFMNVFMQIVNIHAHMKRFTAETQLINQLISLKKM